MRNKTRNFTTILFILIPFLWGMPVYAQKPLKKPVRVVETKKVQQSKPAKQSPQPVAFGTVNGHDYVDLGLSVKWATCNVGARTPEQYGDYFAWGEINTKADYTEKNCKTNNKFISNIAGNSTYDVARVRWTNGWRLPTKEEFEELTKKCKMTWTTYRGADGYLFERNGQSIFLPAAGRWIGMSFCSEMSGFYWCSIPYREDAYCLYISSSDFGSYYSKRYYGLSVRPVLD